MLVLNIRSAIQSVRSLSGRYLAPLACGISVSLVTCPSVQAGPWVDAGNWQLRHHLQVLVDAGLISIPLSTWPVTWQSIDQGLQQLDEHALKTNQIDSVHYLKRELLQATQGLTLKQRSHLSGARTGLKAFDQQGREAIENSLAVDWMGDHLAANVQITRVEDPLDNQSTRIDGSYVTGILGNWAFGIGAVDRWWGPGWQNSLILSDNARPTPGVFIQRNASDAFATPLLSWIGPWQLTSFIGQLEEHRDHAKPNLWGMRGSFRPLPNLELGLSRVAMFGGKGRPESPKTFFNLITGNDNRGGDGIAEDGSNEPGNQLAGFDGRLSWHLGAISGAGYAQIIGEDEAGGFPSRNIGLAGLEVFSSVGPIQTRLILEACTTTVSFEQGSPMYNVAYEHGIYFSGYRFRGRPIGASTDNDSETYSLRGLHFWTDDQAVFWTLSHSNINRDQINVPAPGGNVFGSADEIYANLGYSVTLKNEITLEAALTYLDKPLQLNRKAIDSGGYLNISTHW